MSQFQFLKQDFEQVFEHVRKAEMHALSDPRGACFWARLSIETIVNWIYKHEKSLAPPHREDLATLISNADFIAHVGQKIAYKAGYIKTLGNFASHDGKKRLTEYDAKSTLKELFHVSYWLSRNYAVTKRPEPNITFDDLLERSHAIKASTLAKIRNLKKTIKSYAMRTLS